MKPLSIRITETNSLLAPYAVPLQGTLGRNSPEPDDPTRFPFQRDRDRIIHAQAFRRLKGKTQVFVAGEGDHYRTRLTHTMEVAQISRDVARTLSLNEDLTECIALAHDLGHPPFAHMGEEALDAWMKTHGSSFEHNEQSLRVVMMLEEHADPYCGLNLHREVLEGLMKHPSQRSTGDRAPSVEAQIVNIADEIAYAAHDCEDGLRAELFSMEDLATIGAVQVAYGRSVARGTSLRGALIDLLVTDLYAATDALLTREGIRSLEDVYAASSLLVVFSDSMRAGLDKLHAFLHKRMYANPRVRDANRRGQQIITKLCDALLASPPEKVLALQERTGGSLPESVKDYVAGMTDDFASTYPRYSGRYDIGSTGTPSM